jgi:hypothetical protein
MGLPSKSKLVGGTTYTVTAMPAMRNMVLGRTLMAAIMPAALKGLGKIDAASLNSLMDMNLNFADFAEGAQMFFEKLGPEEMKTAVKEMLETATFERNGETGMLWPIFDVEFAGRGWDMMQVLGLALEVNFKGFFPESLAAKLSALRAAGAAKLKSPNTSKPVGLAIG